MSIKMVFDDRNYVGKLNDDEVYFVIKNAEYVLNHVLTIMGFLYMKDIYKYLNMPWGDDWKDELCRNNAYESHYVMFENIRKNEDGKYEFEISVLSD